jgi:hypothetical protein
MNMEHHILILNHLKDCLEEAQRDYGNLLDEVSIIGEGL